MKIMMTLTLFAALMSPQSCSIPVTGPRLFDEAQVQLSIEEYWIDREGLLHTGIVLQNNSDLDICLRDPAESSIMINVIDRRTENLVIGRQEGEYVGKNSIPASPLRSSNLLVVHPLESVAVHEITRPLSEAYLANSQYVRIDGPIDKARLSIIAEATLTNCGFKDPDDALRKGQFQDLWSPPVKLTKKLGAFIQ